MTIESRLQAALRSAQPAIALRTLVLDLATEGTTKTKIYDQLEQFMVQQRSQPDFREQDEEILLDLLDVLSGECHPSAQLLP